MIEGVQSKKNLYIYVNNFNLTKTSSLVLYTKRDSHSIYEPTSLFKTTTTKCKDLNIISKSKSVHNHTCLNVVKSCCNCVSIMLLPIPNTKEEDIHILYKLIRTLQSLHWCGLVAKSTSTQLLWVS